MKFTNTKPAEEGFYWCKPVFGPVGYMECDDSIEPGISIAQIVTLNRISIGSNIHVRFIGHKYPYSINSTIIANTLWGERIKE